MRKVTQTTPKPDKAISPYYSDPRQREYWAGAQVKQKQFDARSACLVRYILAKVNFLYPEKA